MTAAIRLTRCAYDTTAPHKIPTRPDIAVSWTGCEVGWLSADWSRWHQAAGHLWATTVPTDTHAAVLAVVPSTMLQAVTWAVLKLRAGSFPGLRIDAHAWPMILSCLRSCDVDVNHCWYWIDDRNADPADLARHGYPGPGPADPSAMAVTYSGKPGDYAVSAFAPNVPGVLFANPIIETEPIHLDSLHGELPVNAQ